MELVVYENAWFRELILLAYDLLVVFLQVLTVAIASISLTTVNKCVSPFYQTLQGSDLKFRQAVKINGVTIIPISLEFLPFLLRTRHVFTMWPTPEPSFQWSYSIFHKNRHSHTYAKLFQKLPIPKAFLLVKSDFNSSNSFNHLLILYLYYLEVSKLDSIFPLMLDLISYRVM